jgi:hypothetical protein
MRFEFKAQKVLDFDIEARPITYLGGDFTTRDITAIACSFGLEEQLYCWLIDGRTAISDKQYIAMLEGFRACYNMADIVTGHYIRKYDLPNINGGMLEFGLPPLTPKLVCDTKQDLVKMQGVSLSQESIGMMLGLEHDKKHMTQKDWRVSNRLQRVDLTKERVETDVRMHQEMRLKLLELGMLSPPRFWYPQVRY